MGERVKVRMLQAVTYGENPTWLPGSVHWVPKNLARVMVDAGEAVYVAAGLDTSVATPLVMRTR